VNVVCLLAPRWNDWDAADWPIWIAVAVSVTLMSRSWTLIGTYVDDESAAAGWDR